MVDLWWGVDAGNVSDDLCILRVVYFCVIDVTAGWDRFFSIYGLLSEHYSVLGS